MNNEDINILEFFSFLNSKKEIKEKKNQVYGTTNKIMLEFYDFMNNLIEKGYTHKEIDRAITRIYEGE